jgi:hypothetical protein
VLVPRLGGHFGIHERIAVTKKLRSLPTVRIQLPPAASLLFARLSPEPLKIAAFVFKLSTDSFFVEQVRDIVGLYLNPPDKALVPALFRHGKS